MMKKIKLNRFSRQLLVTILTVMWIGYLLYIQQVLLAFILVVMYFIQTIFYKKSILVHIHKKYLLSFIAFAIGFRFIFLAVVSDFISEKLVTNYFFDYSSAIAGMLILLIFFLSITEDILKREK